MKLNDEQIFFHSEALHNDFCIMFEHNKCNMKQYVLKKEAIEKDKYDKPRLMFSYAIKVFHSN